MGKIRGERSPFPTKGKPETGIFSSKGSQKQDSVSAFKHRDVQSYAKDCSHDKIAPKKRNNMLKGG